MDRNEHFFTSPALPFVEVRKSTNSGRHYKMHMHRRFGIGAIDRGQVIYTVGKQKSDLNPDTTHCCNPSGRRTRTYYMLYQDVDWCLNVQTDLWGTKEYLPVKKIAGTALACFGVALFLE